MPQSNLVGWLQLVLSSCLFGFLVFGSKLLGLSGFSLIQVLVIPKVIVLVSLFKFAYKDAKIFYSFPLWLVILYPVNQICMSLGQIVPIFMGLSVSMTIFLNYTQPLWTVIISIFFLKEKIKIVDMAVLMVMSLGLVILLQPSNSAENASFFGVVIASLGGLFMALWIVFNARFVRGKMPPVSLTFYSSMYQPCFFILTYPILLNFYPDESISGFSLDKPISAWMLIIIHSLSVYVFAIVLFYKAAKKIPNIYLGLVLLLEPVVAVFLDVLFLNTVLSWNYVVGGCLIISANVFLIWKKECNTKNSEEK